MFCLLKVKVEVWARAEFEYGAEAVVVDLDSVVVLDDSSVAELFVDLVLSDSVPNVVLLDLFTPVVVKVMDLAGYLSTGVQVVSLVHF